MLERDDDRDQPRQWPADLLRSPFTHRRGQGPERPSRSGDRDFWNDRYRHRSAPALRRLLRTPQSDPGRSVRLVGFVSRSVAVGPWRSLAHGIAAIRGRAAADGDPRGPAGCEGSQLDPRLMVEPGRRRTLPG